MIRIRTGEHLTLHQFCNDWISANTDDGKPVIVTPLAVRVDDAEIVAMRADPNPGTFWSEFEYNPATCRFRRIRPRR